MSAPELGTSRAEVALNSTKQPEYNPELPSARERVSEKEHIALGKIVWDILNLESLEAVGSLIEQKISERVQYGVIRTTKLQDDVDKASRKSRRELISPGQWHLGKGEERRSVHIRIPDERERRHHLSPRRIARRFYYRTMNEKLEGFAEAVEIFYYQYRQQTDVLQRVSEWYYPKPSDEPEEAESEEDADAAGPATKEAKQAAYALMDIRYVDELEHHPVSMLAVSTEHGLLSSLPALYGKRSQLEQKLEHEGSHEDTLDVADKDQGKLRRELELVKYQIAVIDSWNRKYPKYDKDSAHGQWPQIKLPHRLASQSEHARTVSSKPSSSVRNPPQMASTPVLSGAVNVDQPDEAQAVATKPSSPAPEPGHAANTPIADP